MKDYEYTGNEDCASMMFVPNGGPKACNYGCLRFWLLRKGMSV